MRTPSAVFRNARLSRLGRSYAQVIEQLESRWMLSAGDGALLPAALASPTAAFAAPGLAPESDTGVSSSDGITSDNTPLIQIDIPAGTSQRIWAAISIATGIRYIELDPTTGAPTGQQFQDNWGSYYSSFGSALSEDRLYTMGSASNTAPIELRTYDLATQTLISQVQLNIANRPAAGLAYLGGKLYASDTMGIVAIDPATGTILYRRDVMNGMWYGWPGGNLAAAPEQNALYSINLQRSLIKIDPASGAVLQEFPNVDDTGMISGLAYSAGKLYACTYTNQLITIDPATGQRLSTTSLPAAVGLPVAIAGDGLSGSPYYRVFDSGIELSTGLGTSPNFQSPALADGTHNIVVEYYSPGGGLIGTSDPLVLQIDTQAPAQRPAAAMVDASNDTGISSTDQITSDTTPLLNVALPAGQSLYYRVFHDGEQVGGGYETAPQFQLPELSAGTHVITIKLVDAAGNVSAVSQPSVLRILSGPSATPSAPTLDPSSNTADPSDNLTSDNTPLIQFAAAPQAGDGLVQLIFQEAANSFYPGLTVQYLLDPETDTIVGRNVLGTRAVWDSTHGAALGDGLLYMLSTTTTQITPYNSSLSVYNAENGKLIYEVPLPTSIINASGLAMLNGTLYMAANSMLHSIDPLTGSVLSSVYPFQSSPPLYTAIGNNLTGAQDLGRLFTVDWMAQLLSIDPATGQPTLVRRLDFSDMLTVGMAYSHGELITVTYEGLLRHYDPTTGAVLSTLQLPHDGMYSAMAGEGATTPGSQLYYRIFADGVQVSGDYELGTSFELPQLADGEHAITIAYVDAAGNVSAVSDALTVQIDTTAPAVQAVTINDGSAQRSMVNQIIVTFSEPVALAADAIRLTLLDGAPVPGTSVACLNPSGDGLTYLLTFSGGAITASSLADGQYKLIIVGQSVQDMAGNTAADSSYSFHRLFGDADGSGSLSQADHQALADALSSRSGQDNYVWYFDFDGDGDITGQDMSQFANRF